MFVDSVARRSAWLGTCVSLFLAVTIPAFSQVNLTTVTPTSGLPGSTAINITGSPFPSGSILPSQVNVTFEPATVGSGPTVTVLANTITTVIGGIRRVNAGIPASLVFASPTAYRVSLAGTAGQTFTSLNKVSITINPPPSLASVTPGSGPQGQSVGVIISGNYTNFFAGSSTVNAGPGITVGSILVSSPTSISTTFTIAGSAAIGSRTVTVTTGGEVDSLPNGFTVTAGGPATLQSVSPGSGQQGQTLNVALTGQNTNFVNGTTTSNFGTGITVNSTTVTDATHATANITIDPTTALGARTVTVTTGSEVASAANAFSVTLGPAAIASLNPASGQQAQTLNVAITGSATHFVQGTTTATFGAGITVNALTITDATHATANITIAHGAATGSQTVTLTTGGEVASILNGFTINAGTPVILTVNPASAQPTQTLNVAITGDFTHFVNGTTSGSLGAGVTTNSTSVTDSTHATLNITVTAGATAGSRTLTMTTGAEVVTLNNAFTVGNPPVLQTVNPTSGQQGQTLNVALTGQNTNFVNGTTTSNFGTGITVNSTTVTDATHATANITIDPTTALGARTVTATTGSEVVSAANAFSVTLGPAAIASLNPASGQQAQTLNVAVTGSATHFLQGTTTATFGAGITVNTLTITDATHATANITIAHGAATGSQTVTLTTGGEVASILNGFTINAGTPVILNINPVSAQQGQTLNVAVTGDFTHFVQGTTTANFGADITVNSVTVSSATVATVSVTLSPTGNIGFRTVTLTTGGEIVTSTNGFQILAGPAAITSLVPSSGTQGTTVNVAITGSNTNFVQGTTTATFGAGTSISSLTINSATSATAAVIIDPAAAPGTRTVTLTTGGQNASSVNGFTIVAGTAAITSITPSSGTQGQTLASVAIVGQFTHWVNGTTTAVFGNGITVNSVTVTDATHATASIAIDPLANAGGRNVTLTTGGEIVTAVNGFNVQASAAALTSVLPNSGSQGQSLSVNITGSGTHFAQGNTSASFGSGISVTVLTINSATTATAQISISAGAGVGARTVTMTTGGENASLTNGFTVNAATPIITSVNPGSGTQGQANLGVAIVGQFTNFVQGTTTVTFGADIVVNSVTVTDSTHLSANITIGATALTGARTITVNTGAESESGSFSVSSSSATLLSVNPNAGSQGQTLTGVAITGQGTHFAQGTSTFSLGSGITVNNLTITSTTTATADLVISAGTGTGARTAVMSTGGEVAALNNAFTVNAATPVISNVNPNSGAQAASNLSVTITGQFTHFAQGTTTVSFGTGVTVNSVTVNNATSITVSLSIPPTSAVGGRTVTVTTGSEIVTSGFNVTAGPAAITSVTPNSGAQGATVTNIAIVGQSTNFAQGTTVASFGGGITVNSLTINSATSATASITIDPATSAGARTVVLTTAGESAQLTNGFTVTAATPVITSVTPNSGQQGQSIASVTITAQFTHFAQGTSTADFGTGVTVNSITVNSATSATVSLAINPTTNTGFRNVTVTTGSEVVTLTSGFIVQAGPAAINSLNPPSGPQGAQNLSVAIAGTNTNWVQGTTTGSFGGGITLVSLTINSATSATAVINIDPATSPGQRTVTLTTGGQNASIVNGFTVVAATPVIVSVNPNTGVQGLANANIAVTGQFTNFVNGTTTADFGAGITINSVTVTDSTHATVNIGISSTAAIGGRNVTLTTGTETETLTGGFTVQASNAAISNLNPASGRQAQTLDVAITGSNTHFANGTTVASFGGNIAVNTLTITGPTTASANISISAGATIGTTTVTLTTGGESASITNGFTVNAGLPAITSVSPTTGHQADTNLNINLTGQFTHFVNGTTTGDFGAGVTVNSVTVTSSTTAVANISISSSAAPGSRTVTLTTGTEVATSVGGFTVTAGIPAITSVSPTSGGQGSSFTVVVTGQFTNFTAGQTTMSFGSGITPGTVTVNGPTNASVPITIAAGATLGARTVTATTGSENAVLTNGFTVTAGAPSITLINPNTGQPSQTLPVALTGQFSNWVQGTTRATFGAGISVGGAAQGAAGLITVTSPTQATANLVIDAAAALGARDVVVTTNSETETVISGFTVQQSNATPPTLLSISPTDNATNVPLNASVTAQFSKPMDRTTFTAANMYLYDTVAGAVIPSTITVDASGRIATLQPTQLLPVSRQFYTYLTGGLKDTSGNSLGGQAHYFTTGFSTDTTGPAFVIANISNGDTGIPLNANINLKFSKGVNPVTQASGLSVQTGSVNVPGTYTFSNSNTQVLFTPANPLTASTVYTVSYNSQLTDSTGNGLTNPGSFSFTTGTAADTTGPTVISYNPAYNESGVGTNVVIRVIFSERINPITITNFFLYNQNTGQPIPAAIAVAPDRLSATLTPNAPLASLTSFYFQLYTYQDLVGNPDTNNITVYFSTGSGADTTAPTVTSISPTNSSTNVPVNAKVVALLSKPIDLTSITNSSIQLSPAAPGTVSLGSDLVTLTFTPNANLSISTPYSVSVNGFRDVDGNAVTPFSSTFTTSSSSTPDTTRPSVTSVVPANGATNVALNSTITWNINKPLNPASIRTNTGNGTDTFYVQANNGTAVQVGGTLVLTNGATTSTVVFTPSSPFPPNATVTAYAYYNLPPTDFAGNALNQLGINFTTANGTDTTPPTVTSVTPPNGASAVGQNTPVVITFSKPLNPNTINNNTFALFNGSARINPSISRSPDNRTITLSTTLPSSATITVVVTHDVTDLVGNHLADFSSQFTSAATPPTGHPNVITQRPGNGATGVPATTKITLITDTPLMSSTVAGALHVSQNGVLVAGSVTASGQNVVFVPSGSLQSGALVQIFLDNTATDNFGNTLNNYNGQFTVQTDLTGVAPTVAALSPPSGTDPAPLNTVVDIMFTKALDPTTVNNSTFFLKQNDSISIPATVTMLSPTVVRITPNSPVSGTSHPFYRINITSTVKDTQGNAYPGPFANYYFYTNTTSVVDTTAPTVSAVSPPDSSTNVGDNATIRVTFSKPIDPLTVNANTISVSGGSYTVMPASINFDGTNQTATITPMVPLPDNTLMTIAISNVTDISGNNVSPLTTHFTTGPGADTGRPSVISSSVLSGASNVPVNSVFTVQFNKPMDPRLLTGTNFYLYDQNFGVYLPASRSFSADGLTASIHTTSPLPVGRTIQLGVYNGQDLAGNTMNGFVINFVTSFSPDTVAPLVAGTSPVNGATNVPINTQILVNFNEPVQPTSAGLVTLSAGGNIPVTAVFSNSDQTLSLVPNTPLQPGTLHTISVSGLKDTSGNTLAGTITSTFTTAPGADLVPPVITSTNPVSSQGNVGRNVVIRVNFNKPIDQLTITNSNFQLHNGNNGAPIPATVAVATDRLSATLTPSATLLPSTLFYFQLYSYTDLAGNTGNGLTVYFSTSASTDVTPPTVLSISPTNTATGVPVNANVVALLSKAIDPTSVANNSIQLSPAVAGTVSLGSDLVTLTFTPSASLATSTPYSVTVSGIRDASGNTLTTFNSSFTTSASSTPDTTRPSVTSISPVNGASGVALNSTITWNINKPLNPATVRTNTGNGTDTFYVSANNGIVSVQIGGTLVLTNGATTSTVVFTPFNPLPANATVTAYAYYNQPPTDFAGNPLNQLGITFTTANGTDTTPPTVTSVTPTNGSSGVGQNQVVSLTFSKALNPNTVSNSTFTLFNGPTQIGGSVGRSSDNRTVTLSATLPASALITVVATSGVTDLAGNHLADFSSQFTTGAVNSGTHPSVITQRPGNGATGVAANTPIYLLTDTPLNPATVPGALHVSQNGVIVSGTTQVSGSGQSILFTPTSTLTASAVIQIFLDATATDNFGNTVNGYSGQFTVSPDTSATAPTVSVLSPPSGTNPAPLSTVVGIQFTKPIDPTTVNSTNFFLKMNDATVIPATVTQISPNTVRIAPNATLTGTGSPFYRINIGANVKDTQGNFYAGPTANYYFYTSPASTTDTVSPTVLGVAPTDNSTNVGDNALIRATFSKPIDPTSVTSSTFSLAAGATPIPASISFGNNNMDVVLTPLAPLPDSTNITIAISGVIDPSGNTVTPLTTHFTTGVGADSVRPSVAASSVLYAATNVPVNSVFTVQFTEPMDTRPLLIGTNFYIYDINTSTFLAANRSFSPDGLSATINTTSSLPASHSFYFGVFNAQDLAGNIMNGFQILFFTSAAADTAPPVVTVINPGNSTTGVPINATLQILFNEPIQPTSTGLITLSAGGNVPVTASASNGDQTITLALSAPLSPNTVYTITVTGVKDTAGNTMSGSTVSTFTTGPGAALSRPSVLSSTPANGATSVPVSTTPQVVFNAPINPLSAFNNNVVLRLTNTSAVVPFTLSFSADYRTATITPTSPLSAATQYTIQVNSVTDQAGNPIQNSLNNSFTTQ